MNLQQHKIIMFSSNIYTSLSIKRILLIAAAVFGLLLVAVGTTHAEAPALTNVAAAARPTRPATPAAPTAVKHYCGGDDTQIETAIDIGCRTKGNAVLDATFAIIRFLSNGVGLVLIGSLVYAGIQYTASNGNPQNIAAAENRIKAVMVALLIYIFAYAMLNYLIPGQLLTK